MFGRGRVAATAEFLTSTVWKGPYDFAVIEQGTVESASNTEVRCLVRSRGGSVTILDVVPEGTIVKKGDTLVELDSSNLLLDENAQQILVSTRESQLAQAENTLKAAQIARTEYLEGLYLSQEKELLSGLFLAEQTKTSAEAALRSAKVLYTKGIVTGLQVESAEASVQDAINKYDAAETALNTLRKLTKQKELTLLDAGIASADANVKAQQQSLRLEAERLKEIQDQIAKCTIRAPAAGQVVYANDADAYRGSSQSQFIVAPGATVRERQVIIWLPNANDMQVRATVNEARVTLMRAGMPVSIRVDALRDELLEGEVTKVGQYAEPSGFWNGNIKKYAMTIRVKNPPRALRVGMNAEVRVHVEQMPSALQLPVQALVESRGSFFSLVKDGDRYETREVEIGSSNDKVATIDRGLSEGDEVVMNPRSAGDLLKLPDLPGSTLVGAGKSIRPRPVEAPAGPLTGSPGHGLDAGKAIAAATPAEMVARYLENDANKDDKLSKAEIARLDARFQQLLLRGDANGDGFLERRELLLVATNAVQQTSEKDASNAGGGPRLDATEGRIKRDPARGPNSTGGM